MQACACVCMCTFAVAHEWVVCLSTGVCVCMCAGICVCVCMSVCPLWGRFTSFTSLMAGKDVSSLLTNSMLCSLAPELREPTSPKWAVLAGTLCFPY